MRRVDLLPPQVTAPAFLLLCRMGGLVLAAPVLSSRAVPMAVRVALVLLFTVLLLPGAVPAAGELPPPLSAATVVGEFAVGLLLGLGAAVLLGAAEAAGDMMAVQVGLSGANVLAPSAETQVPVLGQLLGLVVLTALVSTGGHVLMVQVLGLSLEVAPPGLLPGLHAGLGEAVGIGSRLLGIGLLLAAPVVAVTLVGNVGLGILSRAVPQLNVLMVAFPVQIALGLLVLGSTVALLGPLLSGWGDGWAGWASALLDLVGGEP